MCRARGKCGREAHLKSLQKIQGEEMKIQGEAMVKRWGAHLRTKMMAWLHSRP